MDYFSSNRRRVNSVTQDRASVPQTPLDRSQERPLSHVSTYESLRAPSSIRIRRLPSGQVPQLNRQRSQQGAASITEQDFAAGGPSGRRRSSSEPQRYGQAASPQPVDLTRQMTADPTAPQLPTLSEESPYHQRDDGAYYDALSTPQASTPSGNNARHGPTAAERVWTGASALQNAGDAARRNRGVGSMRGGNEPVPRNVPADDSEYHSDVVDLLDLVDPEVRAIGTLTNVQNSLFVPDLGRLINRRPTYDLSRRGDTATSNISARERRPRERAGTNAATLTRPPSGMPTIPQGQPFEDDIELQPSLGRRMSISSTLSDSRYAVLPHGLSLHGWSEEDKAELDDHVRHLLHSKREGFKRSMRGFRQYISKPLGLFVFLYAVLVTLFGAAWVFFLIGWIYVGNKQHYLINIVDNVLVALFALMGDGLAPFRMVDTYHMCFIARYYHLTWRLRQEKNLPGLVDHNDLPDRRVSSADLEDMIDKEETAEFSVLKPIQQKRLQYHQAKFSKAHTFYRPHETSTHHAFPLRLLVAIVVLLDCHSCFQVALGTCTWSWNYRTRPQALTATILSCSITCNIVAGVLISVGDRRTRKKDVLERLFRQELTTEALGRMKRQHMDNQDLKQDIDVKLDKSASQPAVDAPGQGRGQGEMSAIPDLIEPPRQASSYV